MRKNSRKKIEYLFIVKEFADFYVFIGNFKVQNFNTSV